MNNILQEYEELRIVNSRLKTITIILIVSLIIGFWFLSLANYFSIGTSNEDFTEFYILLGTSLFLGVLIYLFAKNNKIAWFLLSLIVATLIGLFSNSFIKAIFNSREITEVWRKIFIIIMFVNSLSAFILLIHYKTKKRLSISRLVHITCIGISIFILVLIRWFSLVD